LWLRGIGHACDKRTTTRAPRKGRPRDSSVCAGQAIDRIEHRVVEWEQSFDLAFVAASVRICIVGSSGKLGRYMVQQALDRGLEVVGVCRDKSVSKLDGAHHRHPWSDQRPRGHQACGGRV
jgi:hypothetical protein